jgi:hypothetical protein
MFNTIVHETNNHDLAISNKQIYENQINRLQSQLHEAATVDNLQTGLKIAQDFEKNLVLRYCNADNCFLNFICVQTPSKFGEITVCFTINERELYCDIPTKAMLKMKSPQEILKSIQQAIAQTIAENLPIEQIIEQIL